MSNIIPSLTTTIPSGSLTYRTLIDANFANILSAFTAVDSALGASSAGLSFLLQEDWARRKDSGDELGGILGGAIFTDDDGNEKFRIDPANQDYVIAAFINGIRRHKTFTGSTGFEGDMSTLSLSDGTYDIYVGLDADGDTSLQLEFGTAESDLSGIHVFTFQLVVSGGGGTYTISRVRRVSRTQFFDNVLLQNMLEVPVEFKARMTAVTHSMVCVPFAHYLDALVFEAAAVSGNIAFGGDYAFVGVSPDLGSVSFDTSGTTADTSPDRIEITPASPYNGEAMAANTFYHFEKTSSSGSFIDAIMGVKVRPAWGVPTVDVNSV